MWDTAKKVVVFLSLIFLLNFLPIGRAIYRRPVKYGSQQTPTSSSYTPSSYANSPYSSPTPSTFHPLDPLSASEINATSAIIRKYSRIPYLQFHYISLKEPPKSSLLNYFLQDLPIPEYTIPRRAFAVVYDTNSYITYETVVNLDTKKLEKWTPTDGTRSPIVPHDLKLAEDIAKADYDVQERCRDLGWTDLDLVAVQPSASYVEAPEFEGMFTQQLYFYGKNFDLDNQYAHPFDFMAIVDLDSKRVLRIDDLPTHDSYDSYNKTGNIVPSTEANFDPLILGEDFYNLRKHFKPVTTSQPDGVSYTVSGNFVSWQKFRFRIGFNPREGLVIHQVAFKDGADMRPILYRMSLAEMYLPYADPRFPFYRKVAFDEGKDGLGLNAQSLVAQVDCPGEVYFLDGVIHDLDGYAKTIPNAICIFEEDDGILWKHTTVRTGRSPTVRSQRLTVMLIQALDSCNHASQWHFYLDGTIEFEVTKTGIVVPNLLAIDSTPFGFGSVVAEQIDAIYHQHFYTLRIDPEIDGNLNTVVMGDVVALQAPSGSQLNPYGNGFSTKETVLRTQEQARTNENPLYSRDWLIRNDYKLNPITYKPVGWVLEPTNGPKPYRKMNSPGHDDSDWFDYNLWVTVYDDDQMFPAGFYMNGSGLVEWVDQDPYKCTENEDVVIWYSYGSSHIPKTEDFPIASAESVSVYLKPVNFFTQNPALDVPPPVVARPWPTTTY